MTSETLTARRRAAQLIDEAIATGVRGEIRAHLLKARKASAGDRTAGLTRIDYENLAVGGRLHDPDRSGLMMRHGKRTGRVWIYRYEDTGTGKRIERQFGSFPTMSVAEARAAWDNLRDAIRTGRAVEVEAEVMTVATLVSIYLEKYARPTKRSWQMDATYLNKYVVAHFGHLPATAFGPEQVRAILGPIAQRAPREAEKVRGVISSMFNVATRGSKKIGNLDGRTWLRPDTVNPCLSVILPSRVTSNHLPTHGEMAALMRALGDMGDVGQAIRLQALTCARVTEVTALRWSELDLDAGEWRLPARRSKNGHPHLVMLSNQAVALLRDREGVGGDTVFGNMTRNNVSRAITNARPALGLDKGFVSHSLRHACLTWLAEAGAGKDIRDRVSNHVETGSTDAVYNKASLNSPAREWLQRWANHLTGLAAGNVVELRG